MAKLPNIMLVGIQGSGKWTQSRKIIEKYGYKAFDTGAELRKIAKTDTDLGKKIKEIIESGSYVPSEFIRDVIGNFVEENHEFSVLFDGPIRSEEQDTVIRPILGKCEVFCLDLSEEKAIERLLHRRVDPETGETFPENFAGNINPKTGNTLIVRADDTLDVIKKRISWSLQESLPLIEKWKKEWYNVHHIDADNDIEVVFEKISQIIENF